MRMRTNSWRKTLSSMGFKLARKVRSATANRRALRLNSGREFSFAVEALETRLLLANDFLLTWAAGLVVGDFGGERGGIFVSRPNGTEMKQITVSQTNNFQYSGDGINLPDDHPSFSPDGTQIVFTTSRFQASGEINNFEIAIMNVDGTDIRRLTTSPGIDTEPVFSPDGTKLAFVSARSGNLDIYTMNLDGSSLLRLTNNSDNENEPAWNHAGTKLAFTRILFGGVAGAIAAKKDVYIMDASTGANKLLIAGTDAEEHDAVWSLDDTRLILSSEINGTLPFGDVTVINIATKTYVSNLTIDDTFLGFGGGGDPTLSPDGTKIAYFKATLGVLTGPQKVHVMNANGTGKIKIDSPGIVNVHPHFGKLADSDFDGAPDYMDIDSPSEFNQVLLQDEARVINYLGTLTTLNGLADIGRLAANLYVPAHGFDSFQGQGVAFVHDLNFSDPPVLGRPNLLLYQPDLSGGVFGPRDPTDIQPDFNYTLVGWGYATKYNPAYVPAFAGFPADKWLVHESGFHPITSGTFQPTTPANDSPRGVQPGQTRPNDQLATPWHERLWDIHFFRRPGGGVPAAEIHDPFGRNLPGNPTGSNAFFYPQLPFRGAISNGIVVEAENFDMGRGFGWNDLSVGNIGDDYRVTDVDIAKSLEIENGHDVFRPQPGEFLQYTVDLPTTGLYDFAIRTRNAAAGGKYHVEINGVNRSGTLDILTTTIFLSTEYATSVPFSASLSSGRNRVRLVFEAMPTATTASYRFDFFSLVPKTAPTATMVPIVPREASSQFTEIDVTYLDSAAMRASSIASDDLLVTGPNGFSRFATLVSQSEFTNAKLISAKYRVFAPGTGWDLTEAGIYSVNLQSNTVFDATLVAISAAILGTFQIKTPTFAVVPDLFGAKSTVFVNGTEGNDSLFATFANGVIGFQMNGQSIGQANSSMISRLVISGIGGLDTISVAPVNLPTTIDGGFGNDVLTGGSGPDTIHGGDGDDSLTGGPGNDELFGENGNDTLNGGTGLNVLDEGPGQGGAEFFGTTGNDVIRVNREQDNGEIFVVAWINGVLHKSKYTAGETIIVHGYQGNDSIVILNDAGSSWEANLFGGDGDDSLTGGAKPDVIRGGPGADRILGLAGADQVFGDDGNDYLFGGVGDDQLDGGNGNDWLYGGGGLDWIYGQGGDDRLFGNSGDDILIGGTGDDLIWGGLGRDVMIGGYGRDYLYGGDEEDLLIGKATIFENNEAVLQQVRDVWIGRQLVFVDRVLSIRLLVNFSPEIDEDTTDSLFGQADQDWLIDKNGV